MNASRLVNRNITAGCGRTSMRLEPEVWDALRELCLRENIELRDLIRQVEAGAGAGGRTSAVRVHVLEYYRAAATEDGHVGAGHGRSAVGGPLGIRSEIEVEAPPPPLPAPSQAPGVLDSAIMLEADAEGAHPA